MHLVHLRHHEYRSHGAIYTADILQDYIIVHGLLLRSLVSVVGFGLEAYLFSSRDPMSSSEDRIVRLLRSGRACSLGPAK
jgi:hypothetical protein